MGLSTHARAQKDAGFSLVELAVVVVVIGILAAIAAPILIESQFAARRANAESVAAGAGELLAVEIALHGTADPEAGSLKQELDRLRAGFESGVPGSEITFPKDSPWAPGEYCVRAMVPDVGSAYAGAACTNPGWDPE